MSAYSTLSSVRKEWTNSIPNTHSRITTGKHLHYERLADDNSACETVEKHLLYRLADGLDQIRDLSANEYRMLKAIIGAAGDEQICSLANRSLATRTGLSCESQVSKLIRKLRDRGFITAHDSANCKRDGRFGLSIAILHIRHKELSDRVAAYQAEQSEKHYQQRTYRSTIRRVHSLVAYHDLNDDQAQELHKAIDAARSAIGDACTVTSALYATAIKAMTDAISQVFADIETNENTDETICLHANSPMHIPITTVNLSSNCNKKRKSANADHFNPKAVACGAGTALEEKPRREIEQSKPKPVTKALSFDFIMMACPSLKDWMAEPAHNWGEFARQTDHLARMCGVHPSVVSDARSFLDPNMIAAILAVTIEKSQSNDPDTAVRNPGGYVRGMINKAKLGQLNLERSLFGLVMQNQETAA